jgi:hypothetical protein
VSTLSKPLKVLGNGDVTRPLFVVADAFSKSAIDKITAAGGTTQIIEIPSSPIAALIGADGETAAPKVGKRAARRTAGAARAIAINDAEAARRAAPPVEATPRPSKASVAAKSAAAAGQGKPKGERGSGAAGARAGAPDAERPARGERRGGAETPRTTETASAAEEAPATTVASATETAEPSRTAATTHASAAASDDAATSDDAGTTAETTTSDTSTDAAAGSVTDADDAGGVA